MSPAAASNKPLQVAVVGLGRLGRRHAENLASSVPGANLCAVCSPVHAELEWARDQLRVPHLYHDYAALLAHPGLDAVFLVTPTSLQHSRPASTFFVKSPCRWSWPIVIVSRQKRHGIPS